MPNIPCLILQLVIQAQSPQNPLPISVTGHTSTVPPKPPSYLCNWSYKHSPPPSCFCNWSHKHSPPKTPFLSLPLVTQAQSPQNPLPISAIGHTSTVPPKPPSYSPQNPLPVFATGHTSTVPPKPPSYLCNWSYKHSPPKTPFLSLQLVIQAQSPPFLFLQLVTQAQSPQNPLPISAIGHTSTVPPKPPSYLCNWSYKHSPPKTPFLFPPKPPSCLCNWSYKHSPPKTPFLSLQLVIQAQSPQNPLPISATGHTSKSPPFLFLQLVTQAQSPQNPLPISAIGHTSTVPPKPPSYLCNWSYKHSPPKTPFLFPPKPPSCLCNWSYKHSPPKTPFLSLQLVIQAQSPQNPLPISATGHTSTVPPTPPSCFCNCVLRGGLHVGCLKEGKANFIFGHCGVHALEHRYWFWRIVQKVLQHFHQVHTELRPLF